MKSLHHLSSRKHRVQYSAEQSFQTRNTHVLIWFLCMIICFVVTSLLSPLALAIPAGINPGETISTIPKSRNTKVTASVVDRINPIVPILISPEDGSVLPTGFFPFVWTSSDDEKGLHKYQFWLDGKVLFDDLWPDDMNNANFTKTGQNSTQVFTLKHAIADGAHSWKVRVFDNSGNHSDSTTWTFVVDTIAPTIVVTNLGELGISVSSADASTVPTEPLHLHNNEPTIKGKTEPNSTLIVTLYLNGQELFTQTLDIDATGKFELTLPALPRDRTFELRFLAIDKANNTAIVDGLPFRIEPFGRIVLPSPFPAIPNPAQLPQELHLQAQNILVKLIGEPSVKPIINSLLGFALPVAHLGTAVILSGTPLVALSLQRMAELWGAAGFPAILPPPKKQKYGYVFDAIDNKPVPYAIIRLYRTNIDADSQQVPKFVQERIADADGLYLSFIQPKDGWKYTIQLKHKDYVLSVQDEQQSYLGLKQCYLGGWVNLEEFPQTQSDQGDTLVEMYPYIPCTYGLRISKNQPTLVPKRNMISLYKYAHTQTGAVVLIALIVTLLAFALPTPWNAAMACLYWFAALQRRRKKVQTS